MSEYSHVGTNRLGKYALVKFHKLIEILKIRNPLLEIIRFLSIFFYEYASSTEDEEKTLDGSQSFSGAHLFLLHALLLSQSLFAES